jgi:dTDP-4-amino-4,6-dideoxygalactose transaminase
MNAIDDANYILDAQAFELEQNLANFSGARHVICCADGTDAIALCLMAMRIRPGDAVIVPSFTFASTAAVVAWLGACPVFADVDSQTYNIDPDGLENAYGAAIKEGLKPRGVVAVDLFGQPADYDALESFCTAKGLFLVPDSAQGFGCIYKGHRFGTMGRFTTTSFFSAKPLGCYGDSVAILTEDDDLAAVLESLRIHGNGKDDSVRIGMNSRLDTLQAAILIEKLAIYEDEIEARQIIASRYSQSLKDIATTPEVLEGCRSVWAQYTPRIAAAKRAEFVMRLKNEGTPTAFYYPRPLHQKLGIAIIRSRVADFPFPSKSQKRSSASRCTRIWRSLYTTASSKRHPQLCIQVSRQNDR